MNNMLRILDALRTGGLSERREVPERTPVASPEMEYARTIGRDEGISMARRQALDWFRARGNGPWTLDELEVLELVGSLRREP